MTRENDERGNLHAATVVPYIVVTWFAVFQVLPDSTRPEKGSAVICKAVVAL